mmetsp:Transcript_53689/g.154114  ORF Transcript_53689/g.154114 Transcript_53689/m.154114 type:complete len:213 (-) Transcript_53689:311-949(-)
MPDALVLIHQGPGFVRRQHAFPGGIEACERQTLARQRRLQLVRRRLAHGVVTALRLGRGRRQGVAREVQRVVLGDLTEQLLQAVVEVLDLPRRCRHHGAVHAAARVLLGVHDVVQQLGVRLLEQVHACVVDGAGADPELVLVPVLLVPGHQEERHPALRGLARLGGAVVQQDVAPLLDQVVDGKKLIRLWDGRPQATLHRLSSLLPVLLIQS